MVDNLRFFAHVLMVFFSLIIIGKPWSQFGALHDGTGYFVENPWTDVRCLNVAMERTLLQPRVACQIPSTLLQFQIILTPVPS